MTYTKKAKKGKRNIGSAVVHIQSSFNNTIISVSTVEGDVIAQSSSGRCGFKGSRKGTPYAAGQVAANVAREVKEMGVLKVDVRLKGPGSGRESAVRAFHMAGIAVDALSDVTPLPHNGCRPAKKRRV